MKKFIIFPVLIVLAFFAFWCSQWINKASEEKKAETVANLSRYIEWAAFDRVYYRKSPDEHTQFDSYPLSDSSLVLDYVTDIYVLDLGYIRIDIANNQHPRSLTQNLYDHQLELVKNKRGKSESGKRYNWIDWSGADVKAAEIGLESLKEEVKKNPRTTSRSALAKFYYSTSFSSLQNTKEALYWAYQDAENGGSNGMLILAHAYAGGNGVSKDLSQSIKWLLLANRTTKCNSVMSNVARSLKTDQEAKMLFSETKQAVSEEVETWVKKHPEAFFTPPEG